MKKSKEAKMEEKIYKWAMKEGLQQEYIDELLREIEEEIQEECFYVEDVLDWEDEMLKHFAKTCGIIQSAI